jgi:hypothetical protein
MVYFYIFIFIIRINYASMFFVFCLVYSVCVLLVLTFVRNFANVNIEILIKNK